MRYNKVIFSYLYVAIVNSMFINTLFGCGFIIDNLSVVILLFSKFIFENYKDTFNFSKQTSAYIAGTVYLMSMVFGPLMGLFVVRQ